LCGATEALRCFRCVQCRGQLWGRGREGNGDGNEESSEGEGEILVDWRGGSARERLCSRGVGRLVGGRREWSHRDDFQRQSGSLLNHLKNDAQQ
jgi:hypothetical protein